VAATREEGVFDEAPTAEGIKHLLSEAIASFPTLGDAVFMGARAGVRPATPDDAPIMGPLPGWEGLSVITGHDAVGIMLSPGSGELMANYIDTGNARPLEPFSIGRFPTSG
jgi:glycine oxidase